MKKWIQNGWVLVCCLLLCVSATGTEALVIDEHAPVSFSDKNALVLPDPSNQLTASQVLQQSERLIPASQVKSFDLNVTYWIYQTLVSQLEGDKEFRIDATGWKNLSSHIIRPNGQVETLPSTGFVPPYNPYLSKGLTETTLSEFKRPFPVFTLRPHEQVVILSKVNVLSIFPPKSFAIQIHENSIYADYRRFGLYLEGLLLGSLLSLTVFALFHAAHSRDRTDVFYALWISVAFMAVFALGVIDGNRLFEFFININGLFTFNRESQGFTWALGLSFAQAVCYVLFARQYLGIHIHFPRFQVVINYWMAFVVIFGTCALTGVFYWPQLVPWVPTLAVVYSLSVTGVLMSLFVCSYLRYRSGFGFAKYFFYAIIPYIIFRSNFVFSVIGLPSPFSYLPDHAFGVFLKNPWTNQAFGICLEALIMALAVVSRTQWLQSELTRKALEQADWIEKQNSVLEATVAERTQELVEKHQALDESHQVIVGSVNYASRLQRGQLPRPDRLDGRFSSFASIWEPRDTIGGDVYWLSSSQLNGPFIVAVADCTGHGVPGAMLSLLVTNSLERIYAHDTRLDPASALMALDHLVRTGLNQDRSDSESDDGCDAVILQIDMQQKEMVFAGAKLGLFHLGANGEVKRYAGARCSLGYQSFIAEKDKPVTHKINYASGDVFAIVTDGVTDQVGGPHGKTAYGYRRLEAVLTKHRDGDASHIAQAIRADFAQWQQQQSRRDDVTAVVFKLHAS